MGSIKEINIKNRTYYFSDGMVKLKYFYSSLLKINKNSNKNIDIYYIEYITMKDFEYVNIHRINPLHFITGEVDGYIEKKRN